MSLFQNSVLNKYLKGLESEKVNEAYKRFTSHFHNTTIQENIRNSKEEQYQGEFLIDLFVNVLGYTKNPTPDFNLTTELKNIKGSKKTDGAILKGGKALAVIELKGTNTTDLSKVETQAFGYKNNQPGCNYVITSNFEKLRFYIDNAVDFEEFNIFQLSKERFDILWLCLSSEYLLKDTPKKIKDESLTQEENVTKKLYKDYALFRNEIFDAIQKENPEYDKLTLFKKTQKLLDRFLFIFFAEDRLLLPPNSIRSIVNQWTDLRDKYDEYFPLYDRFKKYFGYMNTGHKGQQHDIFAYSGGLFAPDEILDNIKINDDLLHKHTINLSNYDFESEVSVNILGHIFEHSLNDIDEIQAEIQGVATEQNKTKRKKDGVFYTPKYITKYIVDNTVGKLCEEKKTELDIQETEYEKERKGRQKATLKKLSQKLEDYRKWLLQITICDPACGSGAFLNQALEFLIAEHQYIDELQAKLFGDSMVLSEVENAILENNIYGVDINEESVEIAKLSLWLRTAQKGRKLTSLNNNIKCGNSLINDRNVAGDKAFNWQNGFPEVFAKGGFDVIIGNPPYVSSKGENFSDAEKQFFIENYQCAVYQIDLYLLFNEKSLLISNQKGIISLIEPNAWMNNLFLKPIRKFLLDKTTIYEIVNTPIGVFRDATVDTVILTFAKKSKIIMPIKISEAKGQDIIYLHSKEVVSFNDNENFDFDILVPQEAKQIVLKLEINKVDLIDISIASSGIKEYEKGKGNPPQTSEDVSNKPFNSSKKIDNSYQMHISGSDVKRYVLNWKGNYLSYGEWIAAPRNPIFFEGERLIIREIPGKKSLIVSYSCENYTVKNTAHIFKIENSEYSIFGLLGILNSKLMGFYFKNKFSEDDGVFPKAKLGQCKKLPISINLKNNINFDKSVKRMISSSDKLNILTESFSTYLSSKFNISNSSKKLQNWYELDFGEFLKELEKVRKKSAKESETEYSKLTLREEAEWMQYFNEQKQKAEELKMEIDKTDKEIDQMVYELYGLTEEEINIVEEATA